MHQKEKEILQTLAKQQLEIAQSDRMKQLHGEWRASNDCAPVRPMVTVELDTFAEEVVTPQMRCESEDARKIEWKLRCNTFNTLYFGDDTIVRDFFPVVKGYPFTPFNLEVKKQQSSGLGHHFVEQIHDLEDDFHKLRKSTWSFDNPDAMAEYEAVGEAIGHILPLRRVGAGQCCVLTQNLLHIMNTETFMVSLYDYPELFAQMMQNLSDDYLAYYNEMEQRGLLLPTTQSERLGQGTYCYTNDLPKEARTLADVWCFFDSQESVGMSPDMFNTFIFPYYKKLADKFGLISFGCCEPVDPFWDQSLSQIGNLRKVSISPWCNEEFMAERLQGRKVVYHRKPSANFLGVGDDYSDDDLRAAMTKTVKLNRGRSLEITQRDVYTLHHNVEKVKRYVGIVREAFANHW